MNQVYGDASSAMIKANEISYCTDTYVDFLTQATGRKKEEVWKFQRFVDCEEHHLQGLNEYCPQPDQHTKVVICLITHLQVQDVSGRNRYFTPSEAIDFGIIDKVVQPEDTMFDEKDYDQMLAQSQAMQRRMGGGDDEGPSASSE